MQKIEQYITLCSKITLVCTINIVVKIMFNINVSIKLRLFYKGFYAKFI